MFGQSLLAGAFGTASIVPNENFDTKIYSTATSPNSITGLNFQPSLTWVKSRTYGYPHILGDSVRGLGNDKMLISDFNGEEGSTNASNANAQAYGYISSLDSTGFTGTTGTTNGSFVGASGVGDYVSWNWKAGGSNLSAAWGGTTASRVDISVNNTAGLNNNNTTFSLWAYITAYDTAAYGSSAVFSAFNNWYYYIQIAGSNNTNFTTGVVMYSNDQVVSGDPSSGYVTASSTVIPLNTWAHIAVTQSSTAGAKIYINGSLDTTQAARTSNAVDRSPYGGTSLIGGYNGSTGSYAYPFAGKIGQVRLFNGVLTASEITDLYNETASDNSTLNYPAGAGCIAAYPLGTNANDAGGSNNGTAASITFDQPGWLTSNTNGTIQSQVSANVDAGFSIVHYVGNYTSGATIGHGLGAVPDMIIVKNMDTASTNWRVYNSAVAAPEEKFLSLNNDDAIASATVIWNDTAPTSTVFSVGNDSSVNTSGENYIAYCWRSIASYSKIGSYTATQTTGSPTITTDFEPKWIMIKNIDRVQEWIIIDSVRGNNPGKYLIPNSAGPEYTGNSIIFSSTGFTINASGGGINYATGDTLVYIAFA